MSILKKGGIIDVVAPSSAFFLKELGAIKTLFEHWGVTFRIPDGLQDKDANKFSANSLEKRAQFLKDALLAEDSQMVWCVRGGYGATKLIPLLDEVDFSNVTKPIFGFSDVTALHIYFNNKYGLKTIHGRGISEFLHKEVSKTELANIENILIGPQTAEVSSEGELTEKEGINPLKLVPLNKQAEETQKLISSIIGGNLRLIELSLGTSWQIDTADKIVLIEEVNERGYKIDGTLEHLKQAGVFDKAKAIIFGDIDCGKEPNGEKFCDFAIKEFIYKCEIPVFKTSEIGHGDVNYPIIFGSEYVIENNVLGLIND